MGDLGKNQSCPTQQISKCPKLTRETGKENSNNSANNNISKQNKKKCLSVIALISIDVNSAIKMQTLTDLLKKKKQEPIICYLQKFSSKYLKTE